MVEQQILSVSKNVNFLILYLNKMTSIKKPKEILCLVTFEKGFCLN